MPVSSPIALPAINTQVQIGNGASPEIFSTIAFISDITGPAISGQVVDVTSMSGGNAWRQKIVTLLDGGTVAFKAFWQPMLASHQNLLTLFSHRGQGAPGVPIDFRMVYPDQDATVYAFSGFVNKCSLTEAVAGVITADVEITITGVVSGPGFFPS